jgi:hypothetical protein
MDMDSRNTRSRALTASLAVLVSLAAALSSGCLVLSLQPAYDDASIAWDEALLGEWRNAEDNVQVTVERGEWRSYRVRYAHPVEESEFSAHLTAIGDAWFLDLMPVRGKDYGAVLIPGHIILRLVRDGERWEVSAIDYDRLRAAMKAATRDGPAAAFDQRQNAVLTGGTAAIREWLRRTSDKDFSAPAVFERAGR